MSDASTTLRAVDFIHALPILVLAGWACLVLLADALGQSRSTRLWPLGLLGLAASLGVTAWSWVAHKQPAVEVFGGMLVVDRFALFLDGAFIVAGILTLLLSRPYFAEHRFSYGEHTSLILLVICGMMMLVHAGDFLMLVIGLETMSLGVYSMVSSWTGNAKSAEAGFKYFLMGAVGSAFLLYGIAMLYGAVGHTSLIKLSTEATKVAGSPLYLMGMFMILGAMGFKVALVPFHGWTPDAYEGAPTPVTGFMAAAVKAAGFGVLMRVFLLVFGDNVFVYGSMGWGNIFWWLAVLTMTLGNVAALVQNNIKRMLAYSSIAHAGYILVGVIAAGSLPDGSGGPVLYYLLAYTFTTLGAFGVVAWIGSRENERGAVEDWNGLGGAHPAAALAMTIFLLSLGGIPPTAGFFGKFYIFKAALAHDDLLPLVIIAALNSVVSIYYYLRPVVAMYFHEVDEPHSPLRSGAMTSALVVAALLVLLLGLTPGRYLAWADLSVMALIGR
jgi:NADH-quinone oxidoreductase subunit N